MLLSWVGEASGKSSRVSPPRQRAPRSLEEKTTLLRQEGPFSWGWKMGRRRPGADSLYTACKWLPRSIAEIQYPDCPC